MTRDFYCGSDIVVKELERENKTEALMIGSQNLHSLATRGVRMHKKALAHASQKWDVDKLEAKESGWSQVEVIERVRKKCM